MNLTSRSRELPLSIDRRFRGPPESGNGGYVCGRLAAYVDHPAVVVRLRVPPPLETELDVRASGREVRLFDGEVFVAEARPSALSLDVLEPPTYAEAEAASRGYRGHTAHWYPGCFVCGTKRAAGDGLHIFPGPVEGRDMVACPWVPDASLASKGGKVAPEFLWSALDCPGAYAFPDKGAVLLGELHVEVTGEVSVGERCVLMAWEVSHEGRKHYTGTALFGESGDCRARGLGTWFEAVRPNA